MKKIVVALSIVVFFLNIACGSIHKINGCSKMTSVDFGHFSVQQIGGRLNFTWITQKEIHNNYFTIELSYEGLTFTPITTVKTAGNNENGNYYSVSVSSVVNQAYYRIKQTDTNGNYSYSNVVQVSVR